MRVALAKCGWGGIAAIAVLLPGTARCDGTGPGSYDAMTLQAARARLVHDSLSRRYYGLQQFDLSDLPRYAPEEPAEGILRLWGTDTFGGPGLKTDLEDGFRRFHPGIRFENNLGSPDLAPAGLIGKTADLGVGRRLSWSDQLAFERIFGYSPLVIHGMTGWAVDPPFAIVVNRANPIAGVTVQQLDGIFGAARAGGWAGTTWHPEFARGPEGNIRVWGGLGLLGPWRERAIHPYVYALRCMFGPRFSDDVLRGSDQWNEQVHQFFNVSQPDGTLLTMDQQIADALARDPGGIAFISSLRGASPGIRVLPVAPRPGMPCVPLSLDSARDHSYPLCDWMYFFANRRPGGRLAPAVREFLRYILSRDGQEAVVRDGKLLPLTRGMIAEERAKLD